MPGTPFSRETLLFLRELKQHNNREWFQAHKQDYQTHLLAPMQATARSVNAFLAKKAPEYARADAAKAVNRIYRDIRFSADKTPYNPQGSAIFTHRDLAKLAGAGAYVAISGSEVLIAGGIYAADGPSLARVRTHIAARHTQFSRILSTAEKKGLGPLGGESLGRMPKGFAADHPAGDLLRRKQWLLSQTRPPEAVLEPDFLDSLNASIGVMIPFLVFLNEGLFQAADPL